MPRGGSEMAAGAFAHEKEGRGNDSFPGPSRLTERDFSLAATGAFQCRRARHFYDCEPLGISGRLARVAGIVANEISQEGPINESFLS